MRMKQAVWILLLAALNSGCSLAGIAARNLSNEAALFKDACVEKVELGRLANETWQNILSQAPPCRYSLDYEAGFKAGFIDFVDAGGTGEPPPLPPKRYQRLRFQTPQGWKAAEDWFAGFRHGAAVAKESGYRLLVAMPVPMPYPPSFGAHPALPPDGSTAPPPLAPPPPAGAAPPAAPPPVGSPPVLPPPRQLPAGTPRPEGKAPAAPGSASTPTGSQAGVVISNWSPGTHCEPESVLVLPFQPAGSGPSAANRLAPAAAPAGQPPPAAGTPAPKEGGPAPQPAPPPSPPATSQLPAEPKADEVRAVSWFPCLTDSPPPGFRPTSVVPAVCGGGDSCTGSPPR
jgi:hypothetical protein